MSLRLVMNDHHFQSVTIDSMPLINIHSFLGLQLYVVRKTESRIPANFQVSDLGETVVVADSHCVLISCATISPTVANRENIYVLVITDPALANTVHLPAPSFCRSVDVQLLEPYPCLT
jgi:hypothetical protein